MGFQATCLRTRRLLACASLCCTLLAVPAAAGARTARANAGGSGGTGLSGGSSPTGGGETVTATSPTSTTPGHGRKTGVVRLSGVVNASGDGITLTVAASGIQGRPLIVSGDAPGNDAGALILIEAAKPGHSNWSQVATATITSSGAFTARWIPGTSSQVALRAVLGPGATGSGGTSSDGGGALPGGSASTASGELSTSALTIPIFKDALATMYGPGFWGHHTACGQRLRRNTLGVASRTLPCGTRVAVYFRGRELTVPVIDRGPFANGASWDLTFATARALGIRQTVTIGALAPAPLSVTAADA